MTAAVDLAAKRAPRTVELAPAVMRDGVQRPAVLGLGWWQVASAAEMTVAEATAAMAEAVAVMVEAAAAAGVARWCIMVAIHSRRARPTVRAPLHNPLCAPLDRFFEL